MDGDGPVALLVSLQKTVPLGQLTPSKLPFVPLRFDRLTHLVRLTAPSPEDGDGARAKEDETSWAGAATTGRTIVRGVLPRNAHPDAFSVI